MAGDDSKQRVGWSEEHGGTAPALPDIASVDSLSNATDKSTREVGITRDDDP